MKILVVGLTLLVMAMGLSGCLVTAGAVSGLVTVAHEHIPAVRTIVRDVKKAFDVEAATEVPPGNR